MKRIFGTIVGWMASTTLSITSVTAGGFNLQVMERVNERLNDFMTLPVTLATSADMYRSIGGFRSNMDASDRIDITRFLYISKPRVLYVGLDDGTFVMYTVDFLSITYREPGEGGYDAINVPSDMRKHLHSCVDTQNGTAQDCVIAVNQSYISCINDCELVPCADDETQKICNATTSDECDTNASVKLCKNYVVKKAQENETLGFIPRTTACVNVMGQPEQTPGFVLVNATTLALGNCYYKDGQTLVNRTLAGPYADCQLPADERDDQNPITCDNTFVGGYTSGNYDPRFRPWYIAAKQAQSPMWTDPYVFYDLNDIGITYCQPIYSIHNETGQQVFYGVMAVDYYLTEFRDFLTKEYSGTDMIVFVVESKSPNYVMASSSGTPPTKYVLTSNTSLLCPYADYATNPNCEVARIPVAEFVRGPMEVIIQRTFAAHQAANFPTDELVYAKENDRVGSKAYITQGSQYTQLTAKNLEWRVFVIMPMDRSNSDAAVRGDTMFVVVCIIATLGCVGCFYLFVLFFRKRRERAVMHADWRFTCAFIFGCSTLNLSSFALLGPNTEPACMLRMWSFNGLFVAALSPLFVKVWRMYKIVSASSGFHRVTMTNTRAFLYSLPLLIAEILLLTIYSFLDPPRPIETFDSANTNQMQTVTCQQQSSGFFIAQVVFDGILVLVGCVLAYKTRDLDPKFGEAKQLGFSMYNVAFTGVVIICIFQTVDLDQISKIILQSVGVLWGSFFCSFAFVLPRLLEVAKSKAMVRVASNKTFRNTTNGQHQVLVSEHIFSESTASGFMPDSVRLTLQNIPLPQHEEDSSSDSETDHAFHLKNGQSEHEAFVTMQQESYLVKNSTTDSVAVGNSMSSNYTEAVQNHIDSHLERAFATEVEESPSTTCNDRSEFAPTKLSCLDQMEKQIDSSYRSRICNEESVVKEIDAINNATDTSNHNNGKAVVGAVGNDWSFISNEETTTMSSSETPDKEDSIQSRDL